MTGFLGGPEQGPGKIRQGTHKRGLYETEPPHGHRYHPLDVGAAFCAGLHKKTYPGRHPAAE